MLRAAYVAVFLLALAAMVLAGGGMSSQQTALPAPGAPLALASGDGVTLAFTLPPDPRPQRVIVLRAARDGDAFAIVADLDAAQLTWVDRDVRAGRRYLYAIRTRRGASESEPSATVEVLVGGTSRITLVGGSTDRALFEVVIYRGGRRFSSRFVHKPGDPIGDLAWVPELDAAADFRLGPRLAGLSLTTGESTAISREALLQADATPLTDAAGRPIELEFSAPAGTHEILQARVTTRGGEITLKEGDTLRVD